MGMNASTIIKDDMTLDQKLAAIDAAMAAAMQQAQDDAKKKGITTVVDVDPADLTMCEGCQ